MSRNQLFEMTRSLVEHGRAGTMELTDEIVKIPAATYTDEALFKLEQEKIFKRLPLMLALTCELREPGAYKTMEVMGIPVLLTRKRDGSVGAFLNMCTHRGNPVAQGSGTASRFMCSYHGWTFKNDGDLIGVASPQDFGTVDKAELCLKKFPVLERAGLIWVTLDRNSKLEIADFLCGYDELLSYFGFADWHVFDRRELEGPNWKTAYDGYLDFYHLPVLHSATFGPDFFNRANYFAWGPHQRVVSPSKTYQKLGHEGEPMDLTTTPEAQWPDEVLLQGVWTIFPHISIASFYGGGGRGALISQLLPGKTIGESTTTQFYVMEHEPTDEAVRQGARDQFDFLKIVVRDEDYATGRRQHAALQTGMMDDVLFGRNEKGGQVFHQWAAKLIKVSDEELVEMFSRENVAEAAE